MNSWLGGFESILKCMVPSNFNWFLHSMLFYHTKYVLEKQERRKTKIQDEEEEEEEEYNLVIFTFMNHLEIHSETT